MRIEATCCSILILSSLLTECSFARADDYKLDLAPIARLGRIEEPYERANDPRVCSLFLQNLRYFARRNLPLSCGQPVAPGLKSEIHEVTWEDLDPDQHPILFKDLVGDFHFDFVQKKEPSEVELAQDRDKVRKNIFLFRRAKLELKGYPTFRNQSDKPSETRFQIVQFGPNFGDLNNPDPITRCEPKRGRILSYPAGERSTFHLVTEDLGHLYERLGGLTIGGVEINLWLMHGRLYTETYDNHGEVQLSELRVEYPVRSEPVCLYHYVQSRVKEK